MKVLDFAPKSESFNFSLDTAISALMAGQLVAIPTETVYGLAGDANNGTTIAQIFEIKQRPQFNPLIAHVSNLDMAKSIGVFDQISCKLAEKFWPGPLTLVLPKQNKAKIHDLVCGGLETIAIRCPGGSAQKLISAFGSPLAAPSANRSGKISPTHIEHVVEEFGEGDLLGLDGGPSAIGIESTIIRVKNETIEVLRAGSITPDQLSACVSLPVIYAKVGNDIVAPGMMKSHYAPNSNVVLDCEHEIENSAMLGFGNSRFSGHLNLSPEENMLEAASNLYGYLRELDRMGKDRICVAPIPNVGLGIAINDRLTRAAAPRSIKSELK